MPCIQILQHQYLKGFFLRLEVHLADPLYFCSAFLISHMLANFLLTTLPSNSLFLTFGVVIHCLSYMDQKSKLPIQLNTGFPNFISGFQAVCCPTMSSSAVCLKINSSSSQNCLHVSLCISFLPVRQINFPKIQFYPVLSLFKTPSLECFSKLFWWFHLSRNKSIGVCCIQF